MTITWNNSLTTGNRQIDLQHQELVELINEADAGHAAGRDSEVLREVIPRLTAYVVFHFGTEERLMAGLRGAVAHAAEHRLAHREFTDRINAMKHSLDAGEEVSLAPLIEYLQKWLVDHIMKTDYELVRQLKNSKR